MSIVFNKNVVIGDTNDVHIDSKSLKQVLKSVSKISTSTALNHTNHGLTDYSDLILKVDPITRNFLTDKETRFDFNLRDDQGNISQDILDLQPTDGYMLNPHDGSNLENVEASLFDLDEIYPDTEETKALSMMIVGYDGQEDEFEGLGHDQVKQAIPSP